MDMTKDSMQRERDEDIDNELCTVNDDNQQQNQLFH